MDTHRRFKRPSILRELLTSLFVIIVVVFILNLLTTPYIVDGVSMSPTFETGQYILVNRIGYQLETPNRGDVVVFQSPIDPTQNLLKRIVGLPNETLEFRNQQVYINGQLLDEPYARCEITCSTAFWQLGENDYFLLGDNRDHSIDSRTFGAVTQGNLLGEALLRYYPVAEMKWLNEIGNSYK